MWDPEAGRTWLIRLVVATLFVFGLTRGVGADTLSEFCCRLHLEAHVGCSPSALRSVMHTTAAAWEQEGVAHGERRPIIGALDDTCLQRMMLVCMDLASGYLLMEEVAVDRIYDTWDLLIKARLKTCGVTGSYRVSDRAKALIQLAETGLDCLSIPDVFHLSHDVAKGDRYPSSVVCGKPSRPWRTLGSAWKCCRHLPRECPDAAGASRSGAL